MLMRLSKEFEFQMAHALLGYDGKCRNIHGHNYKLRVTVEGPPVNDPSCAKDGMVMDFTDIKRIIGERIIEPFDHAFVVPEGSPFAGTTDTKIIVTPFQPTCENLLLHFASLLDGCLPPNVRIHSLRLHETDSSFAELVM